MDESRWTNDSGVLASAPNTATAPPVDGSFEYGYHGEERDYFCLGANLGGCGREDWSEQVDEYEAKMQRLREQF